MSWPSHSLHAIGGTRPLRRDRDRDAARQPGSPGHPAAPHPSSDGPGAAVPSDLTPEECQELENIRRRKQELLADIQVDEFNIQVLHAFVELHEFTDLNLVQALRQFLWSFRLPGEAQKIDRMMEAFAQRYCQCNPGVFQSTDTCYVLSFAIIMLNTSLHNPNVKDKPTAERFIAMNRGINDGGDLPEELLRNLYESIKNEPFKIPEDDGNDLTHTFFNPDREGWLLKLGSTEHGGPVEGQEAADGAQPPWGRRPYVQEPSIVPGLGGRSRLSG
ncbi:hypothetical protein llap_21745 [Limosa lapponica baueri]|uniref:SEC7 domain-containing protein n=1 Tax=Limosa lapponica baueri TaxID=1758121 RepID=A0A2I0T2D9_LIMLA|nr:hypothetical protein llap_21745 [Limosa lapponica baueri]